MDFLMDFENKDFTILIAEDSPTQAEQIKYILEKHLFKVILARDGDEAFQLTNEHMPSLVISDIVMPKMQGFELCRWLKADEKTKDIPVILLTSLTHVDDIIDGLECGADSFINKPCSEKFLIPHVKNILKGQKLNQGKNIELSIEVAVAGKTRFISIDPVKMISMMISTYESAINNNLDLIHTQNELQTFNNRLEELVEERTTALTNKISILQQSATKLLTTNHLYALLCSVNKAIRKTRDTHILLQDICRFATTDGNFQAAWIGISDVNTRKIIQAASAGIFSDLENADLGKSLTNIVFQTGEHYISNEINTAVTLSDTAKQYAISLGISALAVLPLKNREEIKGSFCLFSTETIDFNEMVVMLLDNIAADISLALD